MHPPAASRICTKSGEKSYWPDPRKESPEPIVPNIFFFIDEKACSGAFCKGARNMWIIQYFLKIIAWKRKFLDIMRGVTSPTWRSGRRQVRIWTGGDCHLFSSSSASPRTWQVPSTGRGDLEEDEESKGKDQQGNRPRQEWRSSK